MRFGQPLDSNAEGCSTIHALNCLWALTGNIDIPGGSVISPGAITYSATAAFSGYFGTSSDGGQFALSAYFPVLNGNPSQVGGFTVELANSAGTVTTARTSF